MGHPAGSDELVGCLFFVGKLVRISRDSGLYLATIWFIMEMSGGVKMTTSDMIRELCEKMNISISELARRIGQSPQNFNKKLQRGTVKAEEMMEIADALGITFEQSFMLPDMSKITCKIAADYLGISPMAVSIGMRNDLLPIGFAIHNEERDRTYSESCEVCK